MTPLVLLLLCAPVDYPPIAYVEGVRPTARQSRLPDVKRIWNTEPSKLMVLRDGTKEVLHDPGPASAILSKPKTLDGKWVYFSKIVGASIDPATGGFKESSNWFPPRLVGGADVFRINVQTKEVQQLTHQETEPFALDNRLGFGVLNLGPQPIPGGKVLFSSDRGVVGRHQIYSMDEDGQNVELVLTMSLGSALDPTLRSDGKVLFSTLENQGLRDLERQWGLWYMNPDGTAWEPFHSSFTYGQVWRSHCEALAADGAPHTICTSYYVGNSSFGELAGAPTKLARSSDFAHLEPVPIRIRTPGPTFSLFARRGFYRLTPWTTNEDRASPQDAEGNFVGKLTHPSPAHRGFIFCTWSPGPVVGAAEPLIDCGIYLLPIGQPTTSNKDLVKVIDEPGVNEYFAEALVPAEQLFGATIPERPWLPQNSGHPELPPGTPFCLVGTSSMYDPESKPLLVDFEGRFPLNFVAQGADAGQFDNSEIHAVRILTMEVNAYPNSKPLTLLNQNETLRILGEIPVRKDPVDGQPVLDPEGNPDTSWLAKIPADVPYTFQAINKLGEALTTAPVWHQGRPGEVRHDCFGCHRHTKPGPNFADTYAATAAYKIVDLTAARPKVLEFTAAILPILTSAGCVACHDGTQAGPPIPFADWATWTSTVEHRKRTAKYFRAYQSRTSLLAKVLKGDASLTHHKTPALSDDQYRTLVSWIDTGAAVGADCQLDVTKPTLYVPRSGRLIGAYDMGGLASLTCSINGTARPLPAAADGVYDLGHELRPGDVVNVVATDSAGNRSVADRLIRATAEPPPPQPPTLKQQILDQLQKLIDLANQLP